MESTDENGMTRVLVNPGPGYYIRCDDCAFVLAESFSDARNIKEFAGLAFTDDETGRMVSSRFFFATTRINKALYTAPVLAYVACSSMQIVFVPHMLLLCSDLKNKQTIIWNAQAELIGRVTFNNKAINSGEDFVNYVKTSATLASCRRVHQVGHTPDEELGIAVLEVRRQLIAAAYPPSKAHHLNQSIVTHHFYCVVSFIVEFYCYLFCLIEAQDDADHPFTSI